MSDDTVEREGAYIQAPEKKTSRVPEAGPSNGLKKYKERHPEQWVIFQKRHIKQAESQEKYLRAMKGVVDAGIELRKSEKQFDHLDQILDTVAIRIEDEHAEAKATIAANNFHRDSRIMDAEILNIQKRKELEKAKTIDADPGDERTADYWEREKQKIEEEERGKMRIEETLSEMRAERESVLIRQKHDQIDNFVQEEKRRFGRDIDLKDRDSWSEDDTDMIQAIEYKWDQKIEDIK